MSTKSEESFEEKRARQQQIVNRATETREFRDQAAREAVSHKPSPDQQEDHQRTIDIYLKNAHDARVEEIDARKKLADLEMEEKARMLEDEKERKLHDDYEQSREEQKQKQQQEQEQKSKSPEKKV